MPLNILIWQYPEFNADVNNILNHWKINEMLIDGYLYGSRPNSEVGLNWSKRDVLVTKNMRLSLCS